MMHLPDINNYYYFNRDISWLSFNERVLMEAEKATVPLTERILFLSIYSSNLDEFYRVRMPALMALQKISRSKSGQAGNDAAILQQAQQMVGQQLQRFGKIFSGILSAMEQQNIRLVYDNTIPPEIERYTTQYFFTKVLAFLQPVYLSAVRDDFFPENNKLYLAVALQKRKKTEYCIINIPADDLPRFTSYEVNGVRYIVFLDDIIRCNLHHIFRQGRVTGAYSFKITRDAELNLEDDYEGDMAEKMEKQIAKRDFGLATRFLHQPGIPLPCLQAVIDTFALVHAAIVEGGNYHNLKDLSVLPVRHILQGYEKWPSLPLEKLYNSRSLLDEIAREDILLHTPYQSYDPVLRFFNEAAIDPSVTEIYVTLYRVASRSAIVNALISAARNGKRVVVLIELKARFDESNNINWARKMKAAGVTIVYSDAALKVHAKTALVKKKARQGSQYYGMLATGNLNESTAAFYTDHVLLTAHHGIVREMEQLFGVLERQKKIGKAGLHFEHLLVAPFNLQEKFMKLTDREISNAKNGLPASITIKLNNLEEKVLINKLYEASNAGVTIRLLVRSICCLAPGIKGMSENISVTRIVDRYLEHGRVFVFHNNGHDEVYMGSADWMNRNIYRRIEVCFPVYDECARKEILDIMALQLKENAQSVRIDGNLHNVPLAGEGMASQKAIYDYLEMASGK